jgi:hypothetical protein
MPALGSTLYAILLLVGTVLLLVSSALQSLWEFGREARADLRPAFFETGWSRALLAGWVLLLLLAGVMLLYADARVGLVAIVVYWLLLPISIGPRVRRRALPPWDDLKGELEKQGYTERNYWRRGDWWKATPKTKKP